MQIFDFFNLLTSNLKTPNILPLRLFTLDDVTSFVVAYRQKMALTLEDVVGGTPAPSLAKKSNCNCT
jgi:hypothetical protein